MISNNLILGTDKKRTVISFIQLFLKKLKALAKFQSLQVDFNQITVNTIIYNYNICSLYKSDCELNDPKEVILKKPSEGFIEINHSNEFESLLNKINEFFFSKQSKKSVFFYLIINLIIFF